MREHNIYNFNGGLDLYEKNTGTCGESLMNGHWEELIEKAEELLHATHDLDNYRMLIQHIISWSSDGLQRLESFLRPHVRKRVQGVIKTMLSSSASGCASALVDLQQQQLGKKAGWIIPYGLIVSYSTVDEAFEEFPRDHPDLRNAVKAQVSVLCQSLKWLTMVISLDIVGRMKIEELWLS